MKNNNKSFKVDFIGIGVPKCGTEWIAECLKEHPQIDFSKHKEINYFLSPSKGTTGFAYNNMRVKTKNEYIRQFKNDGNKKGEFSNHYFWDTDALIKIKEAFPNIKILVSIRNPVEYLYSIYWYLKYSNMYNKIPNNFEKAIEKAKEEDLYNKSRALFAKQISVIFNIFGKHNVLVVTTQDIKENSGEVLKKMFKFIGVDSEFKPKLTDQRINKTTTVRSPFLMSIANKTVVILEKLQLNKTLNYLMNQPNPIKFFYRRYFFTNKEYPKINEKTRKVLTRFYYKDIEYLEKLLDKNLSDWKKI